MTINKMYEQLDSLIKLSKDATVETLAEFIKENPLLKSTKKHSLLWTEGQKEEIRHDLITIFEMLIRTMKKSLQFQESNTKIPENAINQVLEKPIFNREEIQTILDLFFPN